MLSAANLHSSAPLSVLIAGAGALGSLVAQDAVMRGHEVIAIRRRPPVSTDGIRWLPADLISGTGLAQVPHSPDVLFYCVTPDARSFQAYRRVYVGGLHRTLDVLQPRRLILASSTSVFTATHSAHGLTKPARCRRPQLWQKHY